MATNRFFRKVIDGDPKLTQLQTNIEQAVGPFIKSPILNGILLEGISLVSGNNKIQHKLGRKPLGYIVVKVSGNVTIYDNLNTEESPELYLPLQSSGTATISVWVF